MWGVNSRQQNHIGDPTCYERNRWAIWEDEPTGPEQYFEDILSGRCGRWTWPSATASAIMCHAYGIALSYRLWQPFVTGCVS
eukprot:7382093-Prymnesium_polylepis.2